MAKPTINSNNPIWANGTDNKNTNFTNEEIAQGIVKQSDIVSNQLNGIAFRADTFIDNLQRCTAWNPNKTYEIGDNVFVNVAYQKSGDSGATSYLCFFRCNQAANTSTPLMQGTSTAFNVNTDTNVPLFTIQSGNNTTPLTSYVNTGWVMLDLTNADLNNATRLSVTGASTLNGATTINNTLSTTGATTLKSTLGVSGHSTLASLGVNGDTTITGNLTSNGTTYTKNISTTGTHTISSTLTANGATNLNSTLNVKGATTLTGATQAKSTLEVVGETTMESGFISKKISKTTAPALTAINDEVVTANWVINAIYPVGSVYISMLNTFNPNQAFPGTVWTKIKSGLFLEATDGETQVSIYDSETKTFSQGVKSAGTETEAGLPNIKGTTSSGNFSVFNTSSGAFTTESPWPGICPEGSPYYFSLVLRFDASRSSAVYGKSSTVQPASIAVVMWQRVS